MLTQCSSTTRPSETLRLAVATVHAEAEAHPLMQHLLSDQVSAAVYADYLKKLLPLYEHLEMQLQSCHRPISRVFAASWLHRSAAIRADLGILATTATVGIAQTLTTEMTDDVASKQDLMPQRDETDDISVWLAVLGYVRYLGDLAGGQQLGDHLAQHLDHPARAEALNFYQFTLPGNDHPMRVFKQLRAELDSVLDEHMLPEFIRMAKRVFVWHLRTFDQIWAQHRGFQVTMAACQQTHPV
jgi:heme oxygenase